MYFKTIMKDQCHFFVESFMISTYSEGDSLLPEKLLFHLHLPKDALKIIGTFF